MLCDSLPFIDLCCFFHATKEKKKRWQIIIFVHVHRAPTSSTSSEIVFHINQIPNAQRWKTWIPKLATQITTIHWPYWQRQKCCILYANLQLLFTDVNYSLNNLNDKLYTHVYINNQQALNSHYLVEQRIVECRLDTDIKSKCAPLECLTRNRYTVKCKNYKETER